MDDQSGPGPAYPIELHFTSAPRLDAALIAKALSVRLGDVSQADDAPAGTLRFLLEDPRHAGAGDGERASLTLRGAEIASREGLEAALSQSFDVENGKARLAECSSSVTMIAAAGPGAADRDRRGMIAAGLMAVLECVDAELVFWRPSGQVLDPAKVRAKLSEPAQRASPTYGFVNVRLFNVEESETHIMDTLGLEALGLPDLQIHFRGLEKPDVADLLYSVAAYLIENGNVIDNGHTVPGLLPGESWTCMHAMAFIAPDRLVLDVNPGAAFSGNGA